MAGGVLGGLKRGGTFAGGAKKGAILAGLGTGLVSAIQNRQQKKEKE